MRTLIIALLLLTLACKKDDSERAARVVVTKIEGTTWNTTQEGGGTLTFTADSIFFVSPIPHHKDIHYAYYFKQDTFYYQGVWDVYTEPGVTAYEETTHGAQLCLKLVTYGDSLYQWNIFNNLEGFWGVRQK